jgi:hypothetical protein
MTPFLFLFFSFSFPQFPHGSLCFPFVSFVSLLEVPFVERQAKLIEYEMSPEEKDLYEQVTAWLMEPYCSFGGKNRRLLLIGFHRRMASSLAALSSSLEKVAERLRTQLAGAGDNGWDEDLADLDDLGAPHRAGAQGGNN